MYIKIKIKNKNKMMESNFINEQTATMKQQTFQPIKNLAKPLSFIKHSIMDAINTASGYQQKNKRMKQYQNYQLADNLPDSLIEGRAQYITTTIKHHNKISFMKTFIRKSGVFAVALLIANLFLISNAVGQTNTWDGSGGANWNIASSWSANHVPTSAEDVVIPNNFTVTVNTAAVCKSFTISSGGNANTVTISLTNSLTVTNAVSIGAGTGTGDNKILAVGTGSLSCASITVTATGNTNRTSGVTLSTGTVTVTGDITMGSTDDDFTFTSAGLLKVGGDMSGGNFTASSGTVQYYGDGTGGTSAAQTVAAYAYNNLTTSGSGTKTLAGTATLTGNLNIGTGTTLDLVTFTANRTAAGGTLTVANGASLRIGGTNIFPSNNYTTRSLGTSSTVEYYGTAQAISTQSYGNLILSTSGNKSFAGSTTIAGNLSISGTAVALLPNGSTSSAATLTLGGIGQPNQSWGGSTSAAIHKNATYFGSSVTGILNVATSTSPLINTSGSLATFSTTYGTASAVQTIGITGSNLAADITATAPTGFEVSSNGTSYASTATFTQSGGTVSGTLSVRLAATAQVSGTYNSQNIGLTSSGATTVNIATTSGGNTVIPKALTVTATAQSKTYGVTAPTSGTLGTNFTVSGLQNSDAVSRATLGYSGSPAGNLATATVAGSPYTITPSALTFSTGIAGNYTIGYSMGSLTVNPSGLTITANGQTKCLGATFTFAGTEFTSTGLLNSDAITSVTLTSAGASAGVGRDI